MNGDYVVKPTRVLLNRHRCAGARILPTVSNYMKTHMPSVGVNHSQGALRSACTGFAT
jgi:hypothetical protein